MGSLRDDLLRSSAYPGEPEGGVDLVETHISWVFLLENEVWKVKKPLDLGFLDFRTIEKRREACEAEVRLNRRLAPDVYLGVAPVRLGDDGLHRIDAEGAIVDWAVRMVRLSDASRGDHLLAQGKLDNDSIDNIAAVLAHFHAQAESSEKTASFGAPEVIAHSVRENFDQTRAVVSRYLEPSQASEIEAFQVGKLQQDAERFRARAQAGKVRDGHGDLRLEHLYFQPDGSLIIIDCIEFNERFRYADVCADVAFLAMDLAFHGRIDFAERLLATYARETGDYDLYGLLDFYESYRAYVRAKVSTMLAADRGAALATRQRAASEARRYFLLSLAAARPPLLRPVVIAVGGVIASGKSTIARKLGEALGAPVVEADRTRKQLLGVIPTEAVHDPIWQGAYDPAFTERNYEEVFRRASVVIGSGRSVVLDASFRSAKWRERARELAKAQGLAFLFIECRAPREVCLRRLARRAQEGGISDGRLAIFDDFCAKWESVVELPKEEHLVLDTSRPLDDNLGVLEATLSPKAAR